MLKDVLRLVMAARLLFLAVSLASFERDGVPATGLPPLGAMALVLLTGPWPFSFLPAAFLSFAGAVTVVAEVVVVA